MFVVKIDGRGGSYFYTREEAERNLEMYGFRRSPYVGADYSKVLFTGTEAKVMTATIREEE